MIAVALALFIGAAALVTIAVHRQPGLSPFDEATHADYAYQVAHGHIPAKGSIIAPEIRAEVACHTYYSPAALNENLPACGDTNLPPQAYPAGGQDYNFGHPPLYYAITGVLARVANHIIGGEHFITLARLVGVLWLFSGMVVLYLALRKFRVRWPLALSGAAALAASTPLLYASATVSNDAAVALSGSLAVFVLARVAVDRKLGWKIPLVISVLVTATKIINALPLLIVAVLLAAVAIRFRREDRAYARGLLHTVLALIGGALIVYIGWTVFQNHRGVVDWVNPIQSVSSQDVHGLPFDEIFSTSFSYINLLSSGTLPAPMTSQWLDVLLRILGPVSIGATVALLALSRKWSPRWILAAATTVGVLAYPLVVEIQVYVSSGKYFPLVIPRYGISFIPALIACIMLAADEKRMTKTGVAFGAAWFLIVLLTVAG